MLAAARADLDRLAGAIAGPVAHRLSRHPLRPPSSPRRRPGCARAHPGITLSVDRRRAGRRARIAARRRRRPGRRRRVRLCAARAARARRRRASCAPSRWSLVRPGRGPRTTGPGTGSSWPGGVGDAAEQRCLRPGGAVGLPRRRLRAATCVGRPTTCCLLVRAVARRPRRRGAAAAVGAGHRVGRRGHRGRTAPSRRCVAAAPASLARPAGRPRCPSGDEHGLRDAGGRGAPTASCTSLKRAANGPQAASCTAYATSTSAV